MPTAKSKPQPLEESDLFITQATDWLTNRDVDAKVSTDHIPRLLAKVKERGDKSTDLVPVYIALRGYEERLEAHYKATKALLEWVSSTLVPGAFDREDTKTKTLKDGGRVTVGTRTYASILTELATRDPEGDEEGPQPLLVKRPVVRWELDENGKPYEVQMLGNEGQPLYSEPYQPTFKELAYDWLRENGHGALIVETVFAPSLSKFAKDLLEQEGISLPEKSGFRTFDKFTTSYTPAKKKG